MVGKHVFGFFCTGHGLPGDFRLGAVRTNDTTPSGACCKRDAVIGTHREMHTAHPIVIACEFVEHAALAHRAVSLGAFAQPFVKLVAVDHAHKPAFNGNVDFFIFG